MDGFEASEIFSGTLACVLWECSYFSITSIAGFKNACDFFAPNLPF